MNRTTEVEDSALEETTVPVAAEIVLARNFGLVDRGESHWWPAGTRFDRVEYADLIARMAAAGAIFK